MIPKQRPQSPRRWNYQRNPVKDTLHPLTKDPPNNKSGKPKLSNPVRNRQSSGYIAKAVLSSIPKHLVFMRSKKVDSATETIHASLASRATLVYMRMHMQNSGQLTTGIR